MKLALALIVAGVAALVACAGAPTPGSASVPGSYEWYVPGRGYAWYSPDSGTYTWAQPSIPPPRRFGSSSIDGGSCTPGGPAPASWSWVCPIVDADHGSLATGAGYLFDVHCTLTTLAGGQTTPLYVLGFDTSSSSAPSAGAVSISGIASGGLTTVGNDVTYADEEYSHGTVAFTSGLLLALSTTADTFTAPSAGNQMRCDAKLSAKR